MLKKRQSCDRGLLGCTVGYLICPRWSTYLPIPREEVMLALISPLVERALITLTAAVILLTLSDGNGLLLIGLLQLTALTAQLLIARRTGRQPQSILVLVAPLVLITALLGAIMLRANSATLILIGMLSAIAGIIPASIAIWQKHPVH